MVVALVAGVWWLLTKDTRGAEIATVLALPMAVLAVLMAARPAATAGETLLGAAWQLAGDVRAQEEAELARLVADIGDTRPADVGFAQPGLLYWRTDGGEHRGSLTQIESYYQGLRRGRLVILGEGGAGKTVLAIALVRDLTAAIVNCTPSPKGPEGRVPVRLSLPAFDPLLGEENLEDVAAEEVATRLEHWLAGHICTVYGVAETTAAALVTQGRILPVLDGLDEMDSAGAWPARAAAVLRALNHPTPVGLRPVVLTCRTDRYTQLTGHLLDNAHTDAAPDGLSMVGTTAGGESLVVQDATVVGVELLTASDVLAYLTYRFPDPADSTRCEQRWRPVIDQLAADPHDDPMVAALRSPLRLFLATTAYRLPGSDPVVLTRFTTTTEIDDHLFGLLIPAVTAQHPRRSSRHYAAADVQRWLSTLARHLHREDEAGRSGTDLRLDQLWPAAGDRAPRYLPAAVMTLPGFVTAMYVVLGLLASGPDMSATLALVIGGGTLVGMAARTATGLLSRSVDLQRIDLSAPRTAAGRRRFAGGLAGGLVFGLLLGLFSWFSTSAAAGLTIGLTTWFTVALTVGFKARPAAIDLPHRLVFQGMTHAGSIFAGWLTFGLTLGLVIRLTPGDPSGLMVWLIVGLFIGAIMGCFFVRRSPWPRYVVACWLLARRGELPRRPTVFLDWAYEAGLMRLSGIAVQFRHRELQAWLTTRDPEAKPALSPPVTAVVPMVPKIARE
jgi:hypothetical protein